MPTYPNGPTPTIPTAGAGFGRNRQQLGEIVLSPQPAPVAKTAAAVLTAAELAIGLITYTGAAANLTLPTVALLEALVSNAKPNDSFEFTVLDLAGAGRATVITSTGWTLAGSMVTTSGLAATFRARKTADGAWTLYRVG